MTSDTPAIAAPAPAPAFMSYSLNFEDVILNRLFPDKRDGFFVDVGAGHPRLENDLFAFYERGWHGINIEPNDGFFALYAETRPRDRTLCMVLSDAPGEPMTYYQIDGSGLSTCDERQAMQHADRGHKLRIRKVPVGTLAGVLSEAGVRQIDVLKVDVEGFEEKVLSGNDWDRFRPRVVLLEVTLPERRERRETNIRGFMEQRGYRHVHFDGLNDFYLEHDFAEPDGLTLPPNVFDGFVPSGIADLRRQVASLQSHFSTAQTYAESLKASQDEAAGALDALRRAHDAAVGEREAALSAVEALVARNRADQQSLRERENETRRLRAAAHGMRAEITFLSKQLEPLHTATERLDQAHRRHGEQIRQLQDELHSARLQTHLMVASRSWALTRPLRVAGRTMRRLFR